MGLVKKSGKKKPAHTIVIADDDDLLCDFKDSKQPERSQARQSKGACSWFEVDPKHFENGASNDEAIEAIKCGGKVDKGTQGIKSDPHLKYKGTKEEELCVN